VIKIFPTQNQIQRAQELFDFKVLNNSITEGDGNLAGALGEVIVCDYYNAEQKNTYDYDIVMLGADGNPYMVDVKTKRFTQGKTPQPNWAAAVSNYNTRQGCDYYCFVGVAYDFSVSYIYGFIEKDNFYKQSIFGKKGEVDPYGNGVWTFASDCYIMQIKDLLL
jgi:hypothetical protein